MKYIWSATRNCYVPYKWERRYHPIWDVIVGLFIVITFILWNIATT